MNKKNIIRLTENDLKNIVSEAVKHIMEGYNDESSNTHYAVNKNTGKIVFSWDYNGFDSEELRMYKKSFFFNDLCDMELNPKEYTILTRKTCIKKGIDPSDDNNWENGMYNESIIAESYYSDTVTYEEELPIDEIEFSNAELVDFFDMDYFENGNPHEVNIRLSFSVEPYDSGDYLTPPSGGDMNMEDCQIDSDNTFKKVLDARLYNMFISDVKNHINSHLDEYERMAMENYDQYDDYNPNDEYDPDDY